ncbi:condensation domain-containing protein [Streptomyces sp. NPDC046324]|uniref:condensation domain-containing protein n=1 Tax=Streptomyces sp. NPDC046324 TaxID=3154915 RepID=UPI0033EE542D
MTDDRDADFRGADFRDDSRDADFRHIDFRHTDFRGADFRDVVAGRGAEALRPSGSAFGASRGEVATTVVVDPGRPPYDAPPVLELRGPMTEGRVAAVLERAATGWSGARAGSGRWEHRLERLGPGHHLLHVAGTADGSAFPAGLVADLLTSPDTSGVPLGPAQLALLRRGESGPERHPVVLIDAPEPLDPARVDSALRALVGSHPLLGARIGAHARGRIHAVPPVYEAVCTVADVSLAREAAAVAEASRRLDPAAGRTLGAVLLRKRRRLALVAHELVADAASTAILRTRLSALLLEGEEAPGAEGARYTEWVASLPAVAADPATTARWRTVAEGRAAASAFRPRAPLPDAAPTRHPGFVLRKAATARLTDVLPGRFGLTPVQLLTGAVGLALARWRGAGHASFDVHTDGRQDSPALARTVGPLAETEPVLLMDAAPGGDAGDFVDRAARSLAAVGRASFAACREHAPDPALRLVLRELVPVLARFTPASVSPGPRPVVPYVLDLTARVVAGGRLRLGLDWLPAPRDGVTEESVDHLLDVLREVLEELAQSGGGSLAATRHIAPSRSVAATPLQRELLADADAHPGTGRQIEQLSWTWHGPLDTVRFTAAWQSVFDHEAVLRSSFDAAAEARVVIHDRVVPEVVRLSPRESSWADILAGDRRRGLDPRSPGPLRVTLLGGPPAVDPDDGPGAPTRVLVTYHRAMLDTWSVRLLLEAFYRAYVAGGTLPGGDRRPDLRDHAHWLAGQDLTAARDFWQSVAPVPGAASLVTADPAPPPVAEGSGTGRTRLRLTAAEAARLRAWAARWGATESGALQAVWALLLYRAAGVAGPMPVRFSVAVTGRGIPLDGVERLPGALCNPVPVSVEVDPCATVPELLARLRDRAIDLTAYEWVSAGQIRGWTDSGVKSDADSGQGASSAPTSDSLLVFESLRRSPEGLQPSLAALGVRVEPPETTGAATAFPVTLVAHDDEGGGLVLTVDHDRNRLADASGVLAHCARLLRALPDRADDVTTVARLLDALPGATDPEAAFVTLRPGTGGVVCLVPSPDTPHAWYARLARLYSGPEALILLHPTPEGARAWFEALRPMVAEGRLPALGAFSGGGAGAYELARLAAAAGARPPTVVLGVGGGSDDSVRELALLLGRAAARRGEGP